MATGAETVTTDAVFIPEVWSAGVYENLKKKLVFANLVTRRDNDVKNFGDTIHVPIPTQEVARSKSGNSDVTFDTFTDVDVDISIDQHKYVAKVIEDIVKVQSRYDLRGIYEKEIGYALANAIDGSLAALESDVTTNVVSAGAALEDAEIIEAMQLLDANDVDRDDRFFVIHPEAMADVLALDKFTRYDATGAGAVQTGSNNGLIADAYGAKVYMSTNVVTDTAVTPDHLQNLLFHKSAFVLALQQAPKMEAEYSVDKLGWKIAGHTIYGVKTMDETRAVNVTVDT